MQPFQLPEFYMPYAARLNPHRDHVSRHTREWSQKMGMVNTPAYANDPIIWDLATFDAHDYPTLCAYTHPDCHCQELELITDWYVWVFFFDDHFVEIFKRNQNFAGAHNYLKRLDEFMPVDAHTPIPTPTNGVEQGLADLWPRTTPGMSLDWLQRFRQYTHDLLESSMWELMNIGEKRIANPIEYIEMRRYVGGAVWSAALVEHALAAEIPCLIAKSRTMQILHDTFADGVHLRNDLFSYQREIEQEGELANCVLVVGHYLGMTPQQAANITNDLLTSRLRLFEHTAVHDLPRLFDHYTLNQTEREGVLRYTKGLIDWQAGGHRWHLQSARYMKSPYPQAASLGKPIGLGTSAARLLSTNSATNSSQCKKYTNLLHQPVGTYTIPTPYMPFTARCSPHKEAVYQHSKQWSKNIGLLDKIGNFGVWDEHRFDLANPALCASLISPDDPLAVADLSACWIIWGTWADDYFPTVFRHTRDLTRMQNQVARLIKLMPLDRSSPPLPPRNALETGLHSLWSQTLSDMSAQSASLFQGYVKEMLKSWIWELENRLTLRIPDPIDYLEMRRKTFGGDLTTGLCYLSLIDSGRATLDPALFQHRTMRQLIHCTIDATALTNDIISYRQEIEFEGELHNMVLVIRHFLDCDLQPAIDVVSRLRDSRIEQFEHIVAIELPMLFEDVALNSDEQQFISQYAGKLQDYISGVIQWHYSVERYACPRAHYLPVPDWMVPRSLPGQMATS